MATRSPTRPLPSADRQVSGKRHRASRERRCALYSVCKVPALPVSHAMHRSMRTAQAAHHAMRRAQVVMARARCEL